MVLFNLQFAIAISTSVRGNSLSLYSRLLTRPEPMALHLGGIEDSTSPDSIAREFTFDIDLNDYDVVRKCCSGVSLAV